MGGITTGAVGIVYRKMIHENAEIFRRLEEELL